MWRFKSAEWTGLTPSSEVSFLLNADNKLRIKQVSDHITAQPKHRFKTMRIMEMNLPV